MKLGSAAHRELFCRSFIESHRHYEPETLPWPDLDPQSLERLRGIPFWTAALDTEREAGVMVSAFAETVADPLIREAIALQGLEEARHARLIQHLIERYDIPMSDRPPVILPKNLQPAFIEFGYGECLDSFLAFGLFAIAREAAYFPESIFSIFSTLVDEEARHIVFFVNWIAYLETQKGRGAAPLRSLNSGMNYVKALFNLYKLVNAPDNDGAGFTATGASEFTDQLTLDLFLSQCLAANTQRMAPFAPPLLQPSLMPAITAMALRVVRWNRRTTPVAVLPES